MPMACDAPACYTPLYAHTDELVCVIRQPSIAAERQMDRRRALRTNGQVDKASTKETTTDATTEITSENDH